MKFTIHFFRHMSKIFLVCLVVNFYLKNINYFQEKRLIFESISWTILSIGSGCNFLSIYKNYIEKSIYKGDLYDKTHIYHLICILIIAIIIASIIFIKVFFKMPWW